MSELITLHNTDSFTFNLMSNQTPDHSLLITNLIAAGLSLLGEMAVIIAYCIFKKNNLQTLTDKLILGLVASDLLETIADFGFAFTYHNEGLCVFNGLLRQFGLICTVMWIVAMAHYMNGEYKNPKFGLYALSSISVPSLFCFAMLMGNITGLYPGYTFWDIGCLGTPTELLFLQFIPVFVAFFYIIYQYFQIWKSIRDFTSDSSKEIFNVMGYPLTLMLAWLPGLVNRVWLSVSPDTLPSVLNYLWIGGLHSMGFVNGVYYAFQIKDRIKKVFQHKFSLYTENTDSASNDSIDTISNRTMLA